MVVKNSIVRIISLLFYGSTSSVAEATSRLYRLPTANVSSSVSSCGRTVMSHSTLRQWCLENNAKASYDSTLELASLVSYRFSHFCWTNGIVDRRQLNGEKIVDQTISPRRTAKNGIRIDPRLSTRRIQILPILKYQNLIFRPCFSER